MEVKMKNIIIFTVVFVFLCSMGFPQNGGSKGGKMKVSIVNNPYNGSPCGDEQSEGPRLLNQGGIKEIIANMGDQLFPYHLTESYIII